MSTLANRKKARANRKSSLRNKVESQKSKTSYNDPRKWQCARNKDGIGSAVIRFLEPTETDIAYYVEKHNYEEAEVPFYVHQHTHGFKGPNGKWFINNCPTSVVERECPVCEANSEIVDGFGGWDAVDDNHPGKKLVRNRKRKEVYYANVLIVSDPANPENEGQVKIFQYGKAIHDQIMAQLIPEFDDEDECDVSDYWDGRNFKLKITKKDGYTNYDKSSWGDIEPVADSDDAIEEILKKQYTLSEFVAEDKYKSYEDLEKEFAKTQGAEVRGKQRSVDDEDGGAGGDAGGQSEPAKSTPAKSKSSAKAADPEPEPQSAEPSGGASDDDEYFASLLDD